MSLGRLWDKMRGAEHEQVERERERERERDEKQNRTITCLFRAGIYLVFIPCKLS
jgi:hypothetical protein